MSFFGRFWRWLSSFFFSKELSLTIVGLPGAGKTTLVRAMSNEDTDAPIVPTIGAQKSSVKIGNVEFNIHDIGGHKSFQVLWESFCSSSNVVLYVVDSSDEEAIAASASQLETLISIESLVNIPILLIANKQDIPGSLTSEEIMARFRLQDIENHQINMFCISAKMKTNVSNIIQWMVDSL